MKKVIKKIDNEVTELDLSKIVGGNTYINDTIGIDGADCSKTTTRSSTATDSIGGSKEDTTTDNRLCPGSWGF